MDLFLHWISTYPSTRYYESMHNFPHTDLSRVLGRVIHLAEGWANSHLTPSTPEERAAMLFSPPLPEELLHFADATLFCDGVEYARWKKDISSATKMQEWYAKKLGGPGWRVMVPASHFQSCPNGGTSSVTLSALRGLLFNSLTNLVADIQSPRSSRAHHSPCPRRRQESGRARAPR